MNNLKGFAENESEKVCEVNLGSYLKKKPGVFFCRSDSLIFHRVDNLIGVPGSRNYEKPL